MNKSKSEELEHAFKPKFQEIGGGNVFKHLFLRNPQKLHEAIKSYKGDPDKLQRWINSFVAAEKVLADKYGTSSYFRQNPDFFREVYHSE
ncbi:MAG: hypothetical protein ABEI52_10135 [Halobacteriaceae archaeon]